MSAIWKAPDGSSVELPKLTMDLSELTDVVRESSIGRERYSAEWDFVSRVLPEDVIAQACDGESLNECDVVALECCYQSIVATYTAPIVEARNKELREQAAALKPMSDAASGVASIIGETRQRTVRRVR